MSLSLFAQNQTDTTQIKQNKQITLGIFNSSGFIMYKKALNEKKALRYQLDFSKTYSNEISRNVNGLEEMQNERNALKIGGGFGIQKTIINKFKFTAYYGADLAAGVYFSKDSRSVSYFSTYDYDNSTRDYSPIYYLNFEPFVGCNYFITPNFALGLEYQYNLLNFGFKKGFDYVTKDSNLNGIEIHEKYPFDSQKFSFNIHSTGNCLLTATLNF